MAQQEPIRPGLVVVTFDASGEGIRIGTNPQAPVLSTSGDSFSIEWRLVNQLNTFPEWGVDISNVTPCDMRSLPSDYHFRSKAILDDKNFQSRWIWEFEPKSYDADPKKLKGQILYDVFCIYRPLEIQSLGESRVQTVGVRSAASVDPTIVMPPKESPGGIPRPGQGS